MLALPMMCFLVSSILASEGQDIIASASKVETWPTDLQMKADEGSDQMFKALLDRDESKCYGKKCSNSGDCCPGASCVDLDGVSGTCLPVHGEEPCEKDSDCGLGLVCLDSGNSKACQLEGRSVAKKGFRETCGTSIECENDKGFCCQAASWSFFSSTCLPFVDTKSCVGPVSADAKPAPPYVFLHQPRLG